MDAFLLTCEVPVRLGAFFGIFATMAVWELLEPWRALQQRRIRGRGRDYPLM